MGAYSLLDWAIILVSYDVLRILLLLAIGELRRPR